MATTIISEPRRDSVPYGPPGGSNVSAVSWGAIFAGAGAAAALSLILLLLGTGLGLSSLSPWAQEGASAKALGVGTILWVTFMQLAASALGGYIAGRLRTKWVDLQLDEVVFRDTAHGFLAWAVATLFTAALLTSTVTSIISGGVQAGAQVAGGATAAGGDSGPMGYMVDSLFRGSKASAKGAAASPEQATAEVTRIFTNAAAAGTLPPEDARYAGQLVAQRTGVSQQEAEKRVNDTFAKLQANADQARKASAAAALWLFISLLIGAFVASFSATFGGRQRDD
jgi:hypothetical protein